MINVIGAGLSGLSLAISLAKKGIFVNLISNMPSERSQSVLAEGGINAAIGEDDSVNNHFNDTKIGGCNLESDENIHNLVNNAPELIKMLENLGVAFNYENNKIALRYFGGQKIKRTAFAKASTGKMIMTALIDECRKYEVDGLIKRYPHHEVIDANIKDNKLDYIILKDNFNNKYYSLTGKTVLAIGGLNGLFEGMVTGSNLNTANLQAILFKKGLEFRNLEFIQYHPTTIDITFKKLLVSESARGEGGRLLTFINDKECYFMQDKHPLADLAPRDIISKEEYLLLKEGHPLFLDLRKIADKVWKEKLSDLRKEIMEYIHLDPKKDLIPITPGIHFFMGGIKVNSLHKTNIEDLYAIGEAASIYHGANRLGGNSLLAALYSGKKVSETIIEECFYPDCQMKEIIYQEELASESINENIKYILLNSMSIIRDEKSLKDGLASLEKLDHHLNKTDQARLLLAKAMILAALYRKESRGAHQRKDYPNTDEKYNYPTSIIYRDDIEIGGKLL